MANACPSGHSIMNGHTTVDSNGVSSSNLQPCFILLDREEVSTYFEEQEKNRSQESLFECSNGPEGPNTQIMKECDNGEGKSTESTSADENLPLQQEETQGSDIYPSLPEYPLNVCNPGTSFDEDLTDDMYPEFLGISEAENILETDIALNCENQNKTILSHMSATKNSELSICVVYNNTESYTYASKTNCAENSGTNSSSQIQTYQIYNNKELNLSEHSNSDNLVLNDSTKNNVQSELNNIQLNENTLQINDCRLNNFELNQSDIQINSNNVTLIEKNVDSLQSTEITDLELNQTDLNDLDLSSDSITLRITESIANDLQTQNSFKKQLQVNDMELNQTEVLESDQLNSSKINNFQINQLQLESCDLNEITEECNLQLNTNQSNEIQVNNLELNQVISVDSQLNQLQLRGKLKFEESQIDELQMQDTNDLQFDQSNLNNQELKPTNSDDDFEYNQSEINDLQLNHIIITNQSQVNQTITGDLEFNESEIKNLQYSQNLEITQSDTKLKHSDINNLQLNKTIMGDLEFNGSVIELNATDLIRLQLIPPNNLESNNLETYKIELNSNNMDTESNVQIIQIDTDTLQITQLNSIQLSNEIELNQLGLQQLTPPDSNEIQITSDSNDVDSNIKDPLELDLELSENYINEQQNEMLIVTTQIAVPTCNTCNNIFENIKDLEFHKRLHTLKPNMFRDHFCTVCKNTFNNHCSFTLHFLKIHKQIKLNDPECIYNGKKACKCQVCFSIFEDSLIFYAHCSPYDYISNLVNSCTVCNEKFGDSASALMDHSAQVHKIELCFVCRICLNKMQLKSSLRRHVQFNHNVRKIHCKRCRNAFMDTAYIKSHLDKPRNMCTYLCPFCDEPISISKDLQVKHIKEHLEKLEANLQCGICLNYFYSYINFVHHSTLYHDNIINILPPNIISKNIAFKKDCITNSAVPIIDDNLCVDMGHITMNDCLGSVSITKVSKKSENKQSKKVTESKCVENVHNDSNDSSQTPDVIPEKEIININEQELVTLTADNNTTNNIIKQKKVLEYYCEHCLNSFRTYKLLSIHMNECKSSKDKRLPKNFETCIKGNQVHGYISRQLKNGMEKGHCLNIKEKLDTLSNVKVKKSSMPTVESNIEEVMYLETKTNDDDMSFSATIDTSDILDYVNLSENEPSTSNSHKNEELSNEDLQNGDLTMADLDFEDFQIDVSDETSVDLIEQINLNPTIKIDKTSTIEKNLKRKGTEDLELNKKSIIQRARTDKMLPLTFYDGNVNIPCLHCHVICSDTYKLENHLRNIHYSCKLCEIIFENKDQLIKHENEHKLGNIYFYMCLCTKAFKNLNALNKHIKINTSKTTQVNPQVKEHCMILKRKIIDLYVKNVNILPSKAVCSYCNNIFDSSCLDHHNKIVHNVCICTKCKHKFVNYISVLNNTDGTMLSICKTCLKSPSTIN